MLKEGVGDRELAEAQKSYLEQQKVQRAQDGNLAAILADDLFDGRTFAYYADLEEKVGGLKPEGVTEAFHKHIAPKRLVVIRAGDFEKKKSESRTQDQK